MKRRVLCTLLALLLVISILPGYAAAAGTGAEKEVRTSEAGEAERVIHYGTESIDDQPYQPGGVPIANTVPMDDIGVRNVICSRIITALSNWETVVDVSDYELSPDFCHACYFGVFYEHPEFFYADSKYSYSSYTKDGEEIVTQLRLQYKSRYSESDVTIFNNVCSKIMAGMPAGTDVEKLLYIHDYLVTHCHYDMDLYVNGESSQRDAYCALVDGFAVCQGYCLAFKHLCNLSRLNAECVISDGLVHAWNVVKVNNGITGTIYYYIDCTWDDPTSGGQLLTESYCGHKNFLRCKQAFIGANGFENSGCVHVDPDTGVDYKDWVNGYEESVYTYVTDETFELTQYAWWKDLTRPVQWVGNLMCYAKTGSKDNPQYNRVYFRESGSATETPIEIQGAAKWPVVGQPGYSYSNSYVTVAALGGDFYYSTPTQIWKLTVDGDMSLVYTLSNSEQAQGYIYGILADGGDLIYYIGVDTNSPSVASGVLHIDSQGSGVTITAQPADVAVTEGQTATFSVTADGATEYQWYVSKDGGETWAKVLNNSTSATYSLTTAAKHNGYQYYCQVSNAGVSVDSEVATLTVSSSKPTISSQPSNVTVAAGSTATFKVTATGATSYQWYYRKSSTASWTAVSAASGKTANYSLTAETRHNGYQYRCTVTNAAGSVYSDTVTLTVSSSNPTITTQPSNVSVTVGSTATFKVTATGATSYQWYYRTSSSGSWTAVSATSGKTSTYKLTTAAKHNGYQYRCKVTNSSGSVYSGTVTLTVKPKITEQPTNQTVAAGTTAHFKVTAENATSYQWYYRTSSTGTWTAVSAASGKTADYSLSAAARHNGYQYRCKVMNATSYVYTSIVTLTVAVK